MEIAGLPHRLAPTYSHITYEARRGVLLYSANHEGEWLGLLFNKLTIH